VKPTDFPLHRVTDLINQLHQATDNELTAARRLRLDGQPGSRERLESALAYSGAAHAVNRAYLAILGDLDAAAAHEHTMQDARDRQDAGKEDAGTAMQHPWPIDGLELLGGTERHPQWGVRSRLGTRVMLYRSLSGGVRMGLQVEDKSVTLEGEDWQALNALAQRILADVPVPWGTRAPAPDDDEFTE